MEEKKFYLVTATYSGFGKTRKCTSPHLYNDAEIEQWLKDYSTYRAIIRHGDWDDLPMKSYIIKRVTMTMEVMREIDL